jgi:hypothetical protein
VEHLQAFGCGLPYDALQYIRYAENHDVDSFLQTEGTCWLCCFVSSCACFSDLALLQVQLHAQAAQHLISSHGITNAAARCISALLALFAGAGVAAGRAAPSTSSLRTERSWCSVRQQCQRFLRQSQINLDKHRGVLMVT